MKLETQHHLIKEIGSSYFRIIGLPMLVKLVDEKGK
jgi:predicted house-cleaning NTP pyrophosphatase (Maf/HAM1 superfamily)